MLAIHMYVFLDKNVVKGCTVSTVVDSVKDTVEMVLPVIT